MFAHTGSAHVLIVREGGSRVVTAGAFASAAADDEARGEIEGEEKTAGRKDTAVKAGPCVTPDGGADAVDSTVQGRASVPPPSQRPGVAISLFTCPQNVPRGRPVVDHHCVFCSPEDGPSLPAP